MSVEILNFLFIQIQCRRFTYYKFVLFVIFSVIGYSKEQFDRISQALISLLSHIDADYRMIVATVLSDLGKETKDVDIALLNSFINDQRVYQLLRFLMNNKLHHCF